MAKFDDIKMQDLLKVEDSDGELTLIFKNKTRIKIFIKDGKLESVIEQD